MVLAFGAFAALAGACGGGGGGGFGSPSEATHGSIRSGCEKAFDCMGEYDAAMHNDTAFADSYGTSVDDCVTQTEAFITQFFGADYFDKLDQAADAGNISFNGDDAQTCVDGLADESCDQFFEQNGATSDPPPECDTALVGTVADGGDCIITGTNAECAADGSFCDETTMTCGPG